MARGGYRVKDLLDMTDEEISFIYHYQNLVEEKREDFVSTALGVVWSKEDFAKKDASGGGPPPDKIFLPLSIALNPNVSSYVGELFGNSTGGKKSPVPEGYQAAEGEEIVSMESLDKDAFLKMIGKRSD